MFKIIIYFTVLFYGYLLSANVLTVDTQNKYSWNEKIGWIDHEQMKIYNDHLEGYLWNEQIGWIILGTQSSGSESYTYLNNSTTNWGVNINSSYELDGYAWNDSIGWIHFKTSASQVVISPTTKEMSGYAWNNNIGWISFSGQTYKIVINNIDNNQYNLSKGWQLLGAVSDINASIFNNQCVNIMWKYKSGIWELHIADGKTYNIPSGITEFDYINEGDGFWVLNNNDTSCTISLQSNSSSGNSVDDTFNSETINWKNLAYKTVQSPYTKKIWLDRNLGASQTCTSSTDTTCYGDYYQWGREADGHEKSNSEISGTLSSSLTNAGSSFIYDNNSISIDWTSADINGTIRSANWSAIDGSSVCPIGFRVPTIDEVTAETSLASTPVTNIQGAFDNFLKLPTAGFRDPFQNTILGSSSVSLSTVSRRNTSEIQRSASLQISSEYGANTLYEFRVYGKSVRCIKD